MAFMRVPTCKHGCTDYCCLCVDEEIAALRAFALAVMEVWPMGDLDGGALQEIAEKHGMLKPETRHEPCGEVCSCNEYADPHEWEDGVVCYRKTPLLKGSNAKVSGPEAALSPEGRARLPGSAATGECDV